MKLFGADTGFRFNPKDRATLAVLTTLGVPASVIRNGHISWEEMNVAKLSVRTCENLSFINKETPKDRYDYFSPSEARQLQHLLKTNGPRVMALFDPNTCPGKTRSAGDILLNMLGRVHNKRINNVVFSETVCPYVQDGPYKPADLEGIHYADAMVPTSLQAFGKAVVKILGYNFMAANANEGGGSAVITSNNGDIITAHHVIFTPVTIDNKTVHVWRGGLDIVVDGKTFALSADQIIDQDPERDIVHLRIPEIGSHNHLTQAQQAPIQGEPLWVIGFPEQVQSSKERLRTYTVGRYIDIDPSNGELVTDARPAGGDSGGAIINSRGELLAIVSKGDAIYGGKCDDKVIEQRTKARGPVLPDLYKVTCFDLNL